MATSAVTYQQGEFFVDLGVIRPNLTWRMDRKRRDRLVYVAAQVARLRDELAEAESELDELLQEGPRDPDDPAVPYDDDDDDGRAGSDTARILALLARRGGEDLTAQEVAAALGIKNLKSVRSILSRLARQRRIEAGDRGHYHATETAAKEAQEDIEF